MIQILNGDCRDILATLSGESVQCCVTSPPYWGLRDYGTATWEGGDTQGCDHKRFNGYPSGLEDSKESTYNGKFKKFVCGKCGAMRIDSQLGLEATPEGYIANMVGVFREVWRVLRNDGTLWVNMGDSYASGEVGRHDSRGDACFGARMDGARQYKRLNTGLKPKNLCMIPARLAMALQADGWYLRSEIIWHKPNPMPESVTDRPTKSHEMIYLLAKNGGKPLVWQARDTDEWSYSPDLSEVIKLNKARAKTPAGWDTSDSAHDGIDGNYSDGKTRWREESEDKVPRWKGFDYFYDAEAIREDSVEEYGSISVRADTYKLENSDPKGGGFRGLGGVGGRVSKGYRNKRTVWTVATQPYNEAHFATFPEDLIKPCILAGSRPGDTVLDPFAGSGTTGKVALELGRRAVLIELNPAYVKLAEDRTNVTHGMF